MGMKFEKILNVNDINYSGYDGELYYAITKDEYSNNLKWLLKVATKKVYVIFVISNVDLRSRYAKVSIDI